MLTGSSTPLCVAAGRQHVAAGGNNGYVYLLRAADGSQEALVKATSAPVRSVALNADETLVAAGGDQGDLRLLSAPSGTIVAATTGHHNRIEALAFAGTRLLASGSRDRTVRLWDCAGGKLQELLTLEMPAPVRWLALDPDGVRLFVLLDQERAVRLWHLDRLWSQLNEMDLGAGLDKFTSRCH
jgi:WD40 repeat protein